MSITKQLLTSINQDYKAKLSACIHHFLLQITEHAKVNLDTHTHTHTHIYSCVPFHLGTPEDVLLVVHVDGEMFIFPLLHRVGACRYRTQLLKLELTSRTKHTQTDRQTETHTHTYPFLILQAVPLLCSYDTVHGRFKIVINWLSWSI